MKHKPIQWEVDELTGCWNCVSHTISAQGYPIFRGTNMHRVLYEELFGLIPNRLVLVRHLCNNKRCINPEHWALGTHAHSVEDMLLAQGKIKERYVPPFSLESQSPYSWKHYQRTKEQLAEANRKYQELLERNRIKREERKRRLYVTN